MSVRSTHELELGRVVSSLSQQVRRRHMFQSKGASQLSWSADGRWIAVARARAASETAAEAGGIHLIPVQGGEPRPITSPKGGFDRDPAFSPDGRRLVYGAARVRSAHLWRVGIEGDRPPERIEAARERALSPASVPSQDRLAFVQSLYEDDIYRFEAGRPAVPVASSSSSDYGASFSPDGRRIAFESGRSGETQEIWLADADGVNPVQLTRGPGRWQGSPSWSPDGRRIAFDSRGEDGNAHVWLIDPDGGGLRRLTWGPLYEARPTWSRDGRWVYYREDRRDGRDIWRVPAAGGPAERVTQNGGFYARESPDGRTLFFTKREGGASLFSRPVAGGPERQVVECLQSRGWADGPDGIYYAACPFGLPEAPLYRLDTVTGKSRLLGKLEKGRGGFLGLAVSPDGKTVLFSKWVAEGSDLMMIENFR